VPGEGEHKLLHFVRSQRLQPGYDSNTSHCIYGADADLIMLGLSTHEAHFYIIREMVASPDSKTCFKCKRPGHFANECVATPEEIAADKKASTIDFQFVKIAVVREYLYLEFKDLNLPFAFDFERIVDDFVFLCFLVGNDFLPNLPCLHIREGALDALMSIYKFLLPTCEGYFTEDGKVLFNRVELMFQALTKVEDEFLRIAQAQADRQKERQDRDKHFRAQDAQR